MSEDVIGKLARFSPAGVDRDAMLFAAGRASVRPARVWKWATAALVVSHLLALGLWLRPQSEPAPPSAPAVTPLVPDDPPQQPPADPYSLLALKQNPNPPSAAGGTPDAAHAPLLAFSRNYQP